jgi:NitT/TauT family transport system permease protein
MATIGVLGWLTSTAVELVGRRLTHWLPRMPYAPAPRPRLPRPTPASSVPAPALQGAAAGRPGTGPQPEEARDEHLV